MKFEFSDKNQQYQYFFEVNDIRDLKHVILSVKYQGAKFPDAVQSKVEFFMNTDEWKRFVEQINMIK